MNHSDVFCFSHLRWNFVFQRPNHLMVRCAATRRVFYVEEPVFDGGPSLHRVEAAPGLHVLTPHLPEGTSAEGAEEIQRDMIEAVAEEHQVRRPLLWFYTPMSLPIAKGIAPSLVVYDCMDELSAFHAAPPELQARERQLFGLADLVFTGGQSLYESKRDRHPSVHAFPSSVDAVHFGRAREALSEPEDQRAIARPRIGYFGVIDERIDTKLIDALAADRPSYQIVMVGPVVKIDPATLPKRPNIHYLGPKQYADLPAYLAGWDVAFMPFALNAATRFISPTKTLEYLAAGKPVVSTAIRDVVKPYGEQGLVSIADRASFPGAVDAALATSLDEHARLSAELMRTTSWDRTWESMARLIESAQRDREQRRAAKEDLSCSTI